MHNNVNKEEIRVSIVKNENCRWCRGSGIICVPNYKMIREHERENDILNGMVVINMTNAVYCHKCYPDTPSAGDKRRHANLLSHISKYIDYGWKRNLIEAVLKQHLISRNGEFTQEDDHELQNILYHYKEPVNHYYESQSEAAW